jgi:hypothetical protein
MLYICVVYVVHVVLYNDCIEVSFDTFCYSNIQDYYYTRCIIVVM